MDNLDLHVLRALRDWRLADKPALLVTVVRTWGSSPRPVGSILALSADGAVVGSVSGGCIEDDLIDRYVRMRDPALCGGSAPLLLRYGVTAEEARRFGLPCGGTLELLVERDPDAQALSELTAGLGGGGLLRRSVRLADGLVDQAPASAPAELEIGEGFVANTFGPEYRMLLIGAGQLTEYLATMALFSGFAVTVCDPRQEYRGTWTVAGTTVVADMPDDALAAFRPDRRSAVIALTHDPKLDDLALMEALRTEAFYVGAIGSRRNNEARRARLAEFFDLTQAELSRLRGPVGLFIGSKTPPEIAVSIMAEVLAVKNGVAVPREMQVAPAKNLRALRVA